MYATFLRPGTWLLGKLNLAAKIAVIIALVVLDTALDASGGGWMLALKLTVGGLVIYALLALLHQLSSSLAVLQQAVERTSAGDLTVRMQPQGQDELARMGHALDHMNQSLSGMVAHIRSNAALVAHSGAHLAHNNRDLSDRTEQQAASLEQTTASVQQLNETVAQTTATSKNVDELALRVQAVTEKGREVMNSAVGTMSGIAESSRRVHDIVGVIDGIAFQTNILALNAAVEAARAGEQGRGFAVVASEVRSLAGRSGAAAKEIKELIARSTSTVDEGVEKISTASKTMGEVLSGIRDVAQHIGQISNASTEQSTSLLEISQALAGLDQITQQNAQMVDTAASAATAMQERAAKLSDAVSSFHLRQGTADEAVAMIEKALTHHQRHPQTAFADFNQAGGTFIDRDLYLFGIDDNGVYRVFGGQPAKIGTRMHDVPGIDGAGLVRKVLEAIAHGGGWVEYDFRNPTTDTLQAKMSYVMRCGDINLGCGVYKQLVSG